MWNVEVTLLHIAQKVLVVALNTWECDLRVHTDGCVEVRELCLDVHFACFLRLVNESHGACTITDHGLPAPSRCISLRRTATANHPGLPRHEFGHVLPLHTMAEVVSAQCPRAEISFSLLVTRPSQSK